VRIVIFTDTVADVNGVSRFICDTAREAMRAGVEVHVMCSTPFTPPPLANIVNLRPALSMAMPSYPQLALAIPPFVEMWRRAKELNPDVIHVSTPGPVGALGRMFAQRKRLPLLGTYHTDFPEYIDRLIGKESLTRVCESFMSGFYQPFDFVFTRSAEYERSLLQLGIDSDRILRLRAGIDLSRFGPQHNNVGIFDRIGAKPAEVRALYVGRVSIEKGLPLLTDIWPRASAELARRGVRARLTVVGDGPYRREMESKLANHATDFTGFRHADELAAIYASSDLFLFPSVTDTLGQVVIEAQASGVAVMVTDQGGPQSVIRNGETGFVISAEDPEAWKTRIVDAMGDVAFLRRAGLAAFTHSRQYDFRAGFASFIQAHETALSAYHRA
jgi:glycosyltransferase involved in cell wall biosynthesis